MRLAPLVVTAAVVLSSAALGEDKKPVLSCRDIENFGVCIELFEIQKNPQNDCGLLGMTNASSDPCPTDKELGHCAIKGSDGKPAVKHYYATPNAAFRTAAEAKRVCEKNYGGKWAKASGKK